MIKWWLVIIVIVVLTGYKLYIHRALVKRTLEQLNDYVDTIKKIKK